MHSTHSWTKWIVCALAVLCATAAPAQTTVAASLYGAFNESASGNGTTQSPANQAGALIELRHVRNPLVGYEATYAYNRANQLYQQTPPSTVAPSCTIPCVTVSQWAAIPNNAHQITADWVVSKNIVHLRPFALAGGGLLLNVPSGGTVTTTTTTYVPPPGISSQTIVTTPAVNNTSTKGVFVYGAGVDWGLLPHIGLRLQYRGNLYKAPALVNAFSSTNAFTHTAEPMIGVYFRL